MLLAAAGMISTAAARAVSDAPRRLSDGESIIVSEFRVVGNTVLDGAQIAGVLSAYAGRPLESEDLIDARDALTRLYYDAGFITSGARVPDQDVVGGVVEIQIVEGRLAEVSVDGVEGFTRSWVRERLRGGDDEVLNIERLERRLQVLQREPSIATVHAHLSPGRDQAESRLDVVVAKSSPWNLSGGFANDVSPVIGGALARIQGGHLDVFGRGDAIAGQVAVGTGLIGVELGYGIPVNRYDTELGFFYRHTWSEIVDGPFERLDVEGEHYTVGVGVEQPLWRGHRNDWRLGLRAEIRRGSTTIGGFGFPFYDSQYAPRGDSKITALRLWQEWSWRTESTIFATRLSGNFGVDAFDASISQGGDDPDGRFVYGLAQMRFAQRFDALGLGLEIIARSNLQVSGDPLLPMERFVVGGSQTVRGYVENALVGDSGVNATLELRLSLWRDSLQRDRLQLAVFGDVGHVWNETLAIETPTISSVGLGLLWSPTPRTMVRGYWGHPFQELRRFEGDGPQSQGFFLQIQQAVF